MEEESERASSKFGKKRDMKKKNKKKGNNHMPLLDPKRGHHVINDGVRKIYVSIIKEFVKTFGTKYFGYNNYMNLVKKNFINEVKIGGLPVDCVLRKAPLSEETDSGIKNCTVYIPEEERNTEDKNAEVFGEAKYALLQKVHEIMREICRSLKKSKKMPNDLDVRMKELRQLIDEKCNRKVFVDEQAKDLWQKGKGPADAERLEKWTEEVEEMFRKIAGEGTIQLVIHWGQWAFRVSEGFAYGHCP